MEHDVFISYSRKDEELVKKIRAALTQANISYWIDKEEIKRGTSYAKAISQADIIVRFYFLYGRSIRIIPRIRRTRLAWHWNSRKISSRLRSPRSWDPAI